MPMLARFGFLVPILLYAVLTGLGYVQSETQRRAMAMQTTVPAVVTEAEVGRHHTYRSGRFRVYLFRYRYAFGGRMYESSRTFPLSPATPMESYDPRVRAMFEVGQEVSAYIEPDRPEWSFLVKRWESMPYALLLFSAMGTGVSVILKTLARNVPNAAQFVFERVWRASVASPSLWVRLSYAFFGWGFAVAGLAIGQGMPLGHPGLVLSFLTYGLLSFIPLIVGWAARRAPPLPRVPRRRAAAVDSWSTLEEPAER